MPAMSAIEMPLLRQAVSNALTILMLLVFTCWLICIGVRRFRQLWRHHKLALAFHASADRKLLLRRSLESLSKTPGITIVWKTLAEKLLTRRSTTSRTPSTPGFASGSGCC